MLSPRIPLFVTIVLSTSLAFAEDDKPKAPDGPKGAPKGSTTQTTSLDLPAARPDPDAVKEDTSLEHLKGLEITLRPGFGGAPSDSPVKYAPSATGRLADDPGPLVSGRSSPYSSGFVGQAMLGYRFHPVISAGVRAGIRTTSSATVGDGSTNLSRQAWDAGLYVRGYPLALTPSVRKHLDPWVGVGVGYMRDVQSWKRPIQNFDVDWTLDHHAVAVPLSLGVDYRVLPAVSIGPSFEYTLTNAVAGCLKALPRAQGAVETSYCSNSGSGQTFMKADSYGVWTAGLDLRATLF